MRQFIEDKTIRQKFIETDLSKSLMPVKSCALLLLANSIMLFLLVSKKISIKITKD